MTLFFRARRRPAAAGLVLALTSSGLAAGVALAPSALAASDTVVISQVYGGGGNTGATYSRDYVQLENLSDTAVSVDGWSVQYASSGAGAFNGSTALTGTIEPGASYVVAGATGSTVTDRPLPQVDADGNLNLSAANGSVALLDTTTKLVCSALPACGADPGVVDLVGFGPSSKAFETAPTPTLGNSAAAIRTGPDTDDNATDFSIGDPAPAGAVVTPPPPVVDCGETPAAEACQPGDTTIEDVQGPGFLSPLAGQTVSRVPGIVTAVRAFGGQAYWIQQTDGTDPASSDGVQVFTSGDAPGVAVGDAVLVSGTVTEFRPGGGDNLTLTEITSPTTTVLSSGNPVPAPLALTPDTVPGTFAATPVSGTNIETITTVDPARSAQEFYEAHEGELVSLTDARVVGPTSPFGELFLTSKPDEQATPRGGTYLPSYEALPTGRIKVESLIPFAEADFPVVDVGDRLTGTTSGPVDYDQFGGYLVAATTIGDVEDNDLPREVTAAQADDELAVATYNVENLSPNDDPSKFARLAEAVVTNLASPDVVTLEEIQDDNGATNDGTVSADETLRLLVEAISAAGGPTYSATDIDPVDGRDGGQPGGNIRNAFLWNPERVTFVEKAAPAGTDLSTTPVGVETGTDGRAHLTFSPGRVSPTDPAWNSSRKPLAGEFTFRGEPVIVIANHFNSKGGDGPAEGRVQPQERSSEVQRTAQARVLGAFVDQVEAAGSSPNVVAAGDFNDYQFSAPVLELTQDGRRLVDLVNTLPPEEQYTYVFRGVSQVLDHIMVNPGIAGGAADAVTYDVVHVNSEYADQASDHEPQVVRVRLGADVPVEGPTVSIAPSPVRAGAAAVVTVSGFAPGAQVSIGVQDGPVLGRTTATTDGTASTVVRVPALALAGDYTLTATAGTDTATTAVTVTQTPLLERLLALLRDFILGFLTR